MNNYNTRVYRLKQDILKLINEQQLPISTIYFIIKDLYRDAEASLNEVMAQESELMKNTEASESDTE